MEAKNFKKCMKCNIEKSITCFGKDNSRKDGLKYKCIECDKQFQKHIYPKHKNKHNLYMKEWYQNNKNIHKKSSKNWVKNNIERNQENQSNYRKNNLEKIREYDNNWKKEKRKNDLNYRIKINLRERIRTALKENWKRGKTIQLLGCSIEEYKLYLEQQFTSEMSWENYGIYWEIDHIIQLHTLDLTKIENQEIAFNYRNTRPH
jgi:hypothetical protein